MEFVKAVAGLHGVYYERICRLKLVIF